MRLAVARVLMLPPLPGAIGDDDEAAGGEVALPLAAAAGEEDGPVK
jgi:hypothetical protein